jgi:ParB/RepB/Spo0J family partition protein
MTPVLESPTQETSDVTGARSPRSTKGKSARNRTSRPERSPIPKTSANGLESSYESATVSSAISTVDFEPKNDATSSENGSNEKGVAGLTQPSTPSPDTASMAVMQGKISTIEGGSSWPLLLLPVEAIGPDPFQPREEFDEAELEELAASIKEHGVQSPVIVRTAKTIDNSPSVSSPASNALDESSTCANGLDESAALAKPVFAFDLIAGERRLRASRLAKVKFIPVIVRDDLTDAQAAELALVENVQRSNLNIIEEGRGYKRLMLRFRFTEKRIAKKVGKSVPTIQAAIKLLELPEEVQTLLLKKQLSAAHGHELLRLAAYPEICVQVALKAQAEKITAASLAQNPLPNVQQLKRRGQVVELGWQTKFNWKAECQNCPFKAFVTSGYGSYCLRPDEWRKKQDHALEMEKQEAARVLEAARQEGEATVESKDLPSGSYCNLKWNEPPAGCNPSCSCRGQISDPGEASKSLPICLNPERFKELQKAQREALEAERKRHFGGLWQGAIQRLATQRIAPLGAMRSADPAPHSLHEHLGEEVAASVAASLDALGSKLLNSGIPGEVLDRELLGQELVEQEPDNGVRDVGTHPPVSPAIMGVEGLTWNKIAPLLVLPALAGNHGGYYADRNWEGMVERTAGELGIELRLDDIMGQIDDGEPLRLLESVSPVSLLLLGAAVLLRQEADHAARWAGPTPLLDFVLELQPARQNEMEIESEMEMESGMAMEVEAERQDDGNDEPEDFTSLEHLRVDNEITGEAIEIDSEASSSGETGSDPSGYSLCVHHGEGNIPWSDHPSDGNQHADYEDANHGDEHVIAMLEREQEQDDDEREINEGDN